MKRALTFAGFLRVAPCPEEARVLTGERAAWEAGASAPVRLSFGGGKPAETSNGSQNGSQNGGGGVATSNGGGAKKTWKLALDDDEDGDAGGDDLVDEDALLESSAPVKRATEVVREWLHGGGAAGGGGRVSVAQPPPCSCCGACSCRKCSFSAEKNDFVFVLMDVRAWARLHVEWARPNRQHVWCSSFHRRAFFAR